MLGVGHARTKSEPTLRNFRVLQVWIHGEGRAKKLVLDESLESGLSDIGTVSVEVLQIGRVGVSHGSSGGHSGSARHPTAVAAARRVAGVEFTLCSLQDERK